jgi:hypothetical protein
LASHRNVHTLWALNRTLEIQGKLTQEGGRNYRHNGRDEVRPQLLVRTEVA